MKSLSLIPVMLMLPLVLIAADPVKPNGKFPLSDGKETVAEYAKRAKLEPTLTLDLGGGVKWEGILIPAGTFVMGSPKGETNNEKDAAQEKQHKVTISRPFYLGKFELTQAQYQKVMGKNPSISKGDDLPVHNVSPLDAVAFCETLSKQLKRQVHLPSEAQWEYACRAGTTTAYHSGNLITDLDKVGWTGRNSGGKLHAVGQKLPNAWGLYDMHGNIREIVQDLYDGLPLEDATDPTGPKDGEAKNHVIRGGAYTANAETARNCRAATRKPTESLAVTGFRIAISVPTADNTGKK